MGTATAILVVGVTMIVSVLLLITGFGLIFFKVSKEISRKKQLWLDCYLKYEDWGKCERIITELERRS
ncbi:MAG: hypothetical protein QMD21_06710 [Candidatus Thermoplasmatota archaeon]|nr:hypothetical protein [Candidatus Thermoplasmatota archaeon]